MNFQLEGSAPEIYERVMVPLWMERWEKALIDDSSLQISENVLDVACGTGVSTRLAKTKVGPSGRVDGLDINVPMLAKAKELAEGLDISWIESDVTDTGLPPGSYDVILCQHGYHYFPDKAAALSEFRRLLVAGGRTAYSIWDGHSPYTRALCDAVERHISPEIANKQRSQRTTPTAEELSARTSDAGFSGVEVHRHELMIDVPLAEEFVPLHLRSMPIAAAFLALDDHSQSTLATEVSVAMKSFAHAGRLVYPDAINIVVGVA